MVSLACSAFAEDSLPTTVEALDRGLAQRHEAIEALHDESCAPDGLGRFLERMADIDQFARKSLRSVCSGPDSTCRRTVGTRMLAVDADNRTRLKAILAKHSWGDLAACGRYVQFDALLIVQHADNDAAFQRTVLTQMKAAMLAGKASRNDYAYLADRVAANAHKPQVYGTQGRCMGDVWKPDPIMAPEGLDRRRHEMGMWPMDKYLGIVDGMCKPATPRP